MGKRKTKLPLTTATDAKKISQKVVREAEKSGNYAVKKSKKLILNDSARTAETLIGIGVDSSGKVITSARRNQLRTIASIYKDAAKKIS